MKFKIMFQRLLESRIELRPVLNNSHRRLKDMLFLDLALASAVKTIMERDSQIYIFQTHQRLCSSFPWC